MRLRRRLRRHHDRLALIVHARLNKKTPTRALKTRGLAAQRDRRLAQRAVRLSAVAALRWARRRGCRLTQVAAQLDLSPLTLRDWETAWRRDQLALKPRGRPAQHADRQLRRELLALFSLAGPHVGLPYLQEIFPEVARAELVELARRWRHACRRRGAFLVHALRWTSPGRVWAADFSTPPSPIDGVFADYLAVRDLASGSTLLALPAPTQSADVVAGALASLVIEHGPPLVLKTDNGAPFVAQQIKHLLDEHHVLHLTSPPRTPRYNGSAEAGIGGLATRAHYNATRNDRPGRWTADDLHAARLQGNATAHPFGPLAPTPDNAWGDRTSISPWERERFLRVYDDSVAEQRHQCEAQGRLPFGDRPSASIERIAITRALITCGHLSVRRRRVSPPIIRQRMSGIR